MQSRLSDYIADMTESLGRLADMPNKQLMRVGDAVNSWKIKPIGSEGYRTAEVTLGGIDTKELSSKTMGSQKCAWFIFYRRGR